MTIEDIWYLGTTKSDTKLFKFAKQELNRILKYYDKVNEKEKIKEKLKLL